MAILCCLLYITTLGPFLYGKTLVNEGVGQFIKDAIVFASYTSDTSKCDEIEDLDGSVAVIAFIKNGEISIAIDLSKPDDKHSNYIFTKRKCKLDPAVGKK